jgi:hypothetical protein
MTVIGIDGEIFVAYQYLRIAGDGHGPLDEFEIFKGGKPLWPSSHQELAIFAACFHVLGASVISRGFHTQKA